MQCYPFAQPTLYTYTTLALTKMLWKIIDQVQIHLLRATSTIKFDHFDSISGFIHIYSNTVTHTEQTRKFCDVKFHLYLMLQICTTRFFWVMYMCIS